MIDGEPADDHHRNRFRHVPLDAARGSLRHDGTRGKAVKADASVSSVLIQSRYEQVKSAL